MSTADESQARLSLRPLTEDDFPLLLAWLAQPHVKQWWDDGDDTLDKVARHYGKQTPAHERFILLYHNDSAQNKAEPIGYMQYEVDEEGIASIDQFIGEADKTNQGIGTRAIQLLIETIRRRHAIRMVTVDPDPANKRAIRCYEKVGFQHDDALASPPGFAAYMMKVAF